MVEKKFNEKKLKEKFYELKINDMIDECKHDLNIMEKHDSIDKVLYVLKDLQHVWVVESKENMKLLGVINRIDLLHLLAPPRSLYHIFSLPESFHHGTIGEAEDIIDSGFTTCKRDDVIVDILKKMIRHTTEKLAIISDDGKIQGEMNLQSLIDHYLKAKQESSTFE